MPLNNTTTIVGAGVAAMNPTDADHVGGPDRPAAGFWAAERRERLERAAVFATKARREMIDAGGIDPAGLPAQARRILDWLTEFDEPTVAGVAALLAAAHQSGQAAAAQTAPAPVAGRQTDTDTVNARLDALARRTAPGLEL